MALDVFFIRQNDNRIGQVVDELENEPAPNYALGQLLLIKNYYRF